MGSNRTDGRATMSAGFASNMNTDEMERISFFLLAPEFSIPYISGLLQAEKRVAEK